MQKFLKMTANQLLSPLCDISDRASALIQDISLSARFLREWTAFDVRNDDIFIVTYPRSGTTWMQLIVYLLVNKKSEFDFKHIAEVAPWFERNLALGFDTAESFSRLKGQRIFKSHLPYLWVPKGAKVIYIERDGRDVALSYYHLYRSHLGYKKSFDEFFDAFIAGKLQYKSYFRYVRAWQNNNKRDCILSLKYEDMRSDLRNEIIKVADFLGVKADKKRIDQIVELSQIKTMKENESLFDHATEHLHRKGDFIRKGKIGEGKKTLSKDQEEIYFAALSQEYPLNWLELDLPSFLH